MRYVYGLIIEKREGKRPLLIPRHRLEDNIKMCLVGRGGGLA
jgi:hypothetical protein